MSTTRQRAPSAAVNAARAICLASLSLLPSCEAELAVLVSMGLGTGLGAWLWGRDRQHRALYEAETLRLAISAGEHREMEHALRRQLALAQAGEAVSAERRWMARLELGALMVAEWRFDEARELYLGDKAGVPAEVRVLIALRTFELNMLSHEPDDATLASIREHRENLARGNIAVLRWTALEGLCLARMGRAREAVTAIEDGMPALVHDPVRVAYLFYLGRCYETIGERQLAAAQYEQTEKAFPGTRLASEARSRTRSLGDGEMSNPFRSMLPEAQPETSETQSETPRKKRNES